MIVEQREVAFHFQQVYLALETGVLQIEFLEFLQVDHLILLISETFRIQDSESICFYGLCQR
jgi:hypothetical protein